MNRILQLFCSVSLLVVLFYTTAHKSFIRLSYEINKLEIIEKFCINKEETTFSCDGKCHLKTQLAKAEDPNPNREPKQIVENTITLFQVWFSQVDIQLPKSTKRNYITFKKHYNYLYRSTIFHPPKQA